MTGRTHDVAGLTALTIVIVLMPTIPQMTLATAITAFGANFVGSLFPDIDQPTSDFWDNFRGGPFISKIVCRFLGGHRHFSHSIFGTIFISVALALFLKGIAPIVLIDMRIVWWSFMIGFVSHILFDMFTKEGVPLFWPFLWKIGIPPFRAIRIRSGFFVENLIIFPSLLILNAYLFYSNYEKLLRLFHALKR